VSSATYAPVYLTTVLVGLERVAASEITAKIADAAIRETLRGKVLFTSSRPREQLLTLRSVDNLYLLIARFTVGPHRIHLRELEAAVAGLDLDAAATAALGVPPRKRVSFVVNASRAGRQTYSRFELAAAAVRGILARYPEWQPGTAVAHELEFRLDLIDEQGLLSVRLTPASFRFRGTQRLFLQAALRPPVAHALVWLSQPSQTDCFVDPFCGSGTILAERISYPARLVLGGDRSTEAVAVARQNVPPTQGLTIAVWDARYLPLDARSVDKVVTNTPFGHRVLQQAEIAGLYQAFARELHRILAPHGHALLLTDQVDALLQAAEGAGLHSENVLALSLKGLHPHVVRLTPRQRPSTS
jgi:23S rRNA G2445 N2-methylase RlmL